ncbi:ABC transporter substrate-binding protein [Streptomyces sp. NPDC002920]
MAVAAVGVAALTVPLAACSSSTSSDGSATVQWWTWDDQQAAAYKKCIPGFEKANPKIHVKITQYAWDDYWTKITTGFVGGTAPDTFQDVPTYAPEYVSKNQLLPLNDYIAKSKFDMKKYAVGLQQWGKYADGNYYGLPKDWSTQGYYYNADALTKAGITQEQIKSWTWNPDDGGTFEKIIAHLTVDSKGVRGDESGFDRKNVKVYGANALAGGGLNGQLTWGQFAPTTGWKYTTEANFPTSFQFSDPRFVKTAEWIKKVTDKGYMPKVNQFSSSGGEQLASGQVALVQDGSWNVNSFAKLSGRLAIAQPPTGPEGKRAAMAASTADSIWKGTKNPDASWAWISYLGTEGCQTLAGSTGAFLPSIQASMDASQKTLAAQGTDISAFTDQAKEGILWFEPLYEGGTEIQSTLRPLTEAYWTGKDGSSVWSEIDKQSKEIFAKNKQ